ncbi:MAG: hypothetical protein IJT83_02100 [Victivallales bacterium]|nr:hypothetical protein [Victivallales bacterium]
MSENPGKLRLKNTDTNRFKVDNEGQAPLSPAGGPQVAVPHANDPGATQAVVDPISLRDTATGRLRRLSDNQSGTASVSPNPTGPVPAGQGAVPLRIVHQENKPAANPMSTATAQIKLRIPGANAPAAPAAPGAPAPAPAAPKAASSTIKLNIRKPGEAAPAAPAAAPAAPAAPVAPAAPAAPDSNTLKIRPKTPGAAPAPAPAASGATVKLKPMPTGGSGQTTVVPAPEAAPAPASGNPPPLTPSASGAKPSLKLKKEEAPVKEPTLPPGTPAAPPASSAATQAPPARTSAPKSAASASAPVNYPAPSAGGESVGTLTAVGILLAAVASIAAIVLNVLSFTTYLN